MATRDLSGDCTALFNRYSCPILGFVGGSLFTVLVWYAHRIEVKTEALQASLAQIERNVDILIDRQPARVLAPGSMARANEE